MAQTSLRFPLMLDGAGRAITTTDPVQIWKDRVAVLLATFIGERPGDLFYGSEVATALYSDTDLVVSQVKEKAQEAFLRYLPDLTLISVEVANDNSVESQVTILILFTVPDGAEVSVTQTVDVATLGLG